MSLYAVKVGRVPGIYKTWEECKAQTEGFFQAKFRRFETLAEAEKFMNMCEPTVSTMPEYPVGKPKRIIYKTEDKGVGIARYIDKNGNEFTVTGTFLPSIENIFYKFTGEWINNDKFGIQFRSTLAVQDLSRDKNSIIEYLSSGLFKGIGETTAKRIYNTFKEETLDVLDNHIERLKEVKGIGKKTLETIKESYTSTKAERDSIMLFEKHGLSAKAYKRCRDKFGDQFTYTLSHCPYKFCSVRGISFEQADALIDCSNEYEKGYLRFCVCAKYVLKQNENGKFNKTGDIANGDLGMEVEPFAEAIYNLIHKNEFTKKETCQYINQMVADGQLIYKVLDGKSIVFLAGIYRIEETTAKDIIRLRDTNVEKIPDLESWIEKAENEFTITLSDEQKTAVRNAFNYNLSLIIGLAGAGKTTTINVIRWIYKKYFNKSMMFFAPTGKAASRIKESTGEYASTIHKGLGLGLKNTDDVIEDTEGLAEELIENKLVVVDEISMLDSRLAYELFRHMGKGIKMVLCGDDKQLQSVGAGAVLRDIIASKTVPTIMLTKVYRQDEGSSIFLNSYAIRNRNKDLHFTNDFQLRSYENAQEMEENMIDAYIDAVKAYGIDNVMMIVPFKKGDAGVLQLNKGIQNRLNPLQVGETEITVGKETFRVNDLVMQLKNIEKVVNGDIGTVMEVRKNGNEYFIKVHYEDDDVTYTPENIEELTLAYAYTVHKSQGSEAKCVITSMAWKHFVFLKQNMLYTAVTRAKEKVILFGQMGAVCKAIQTEDNQKRITALRYLLTLENGDLVKL